MPSFIINSDAKVKRSHFRVITIYLHFIYKDMTFELQNSIKKTAQAYNVHLGNIKLNIIYAQKRYLPDLNLLSFASFLLFSQEVRCNCREQFQQKNFFFILSHFNTELFQYRIFMHLIA